VSKLEDLQPGLLLAGVIPGQNVSVIAVQPHGADAIELTYKTPEGELGQRVLGRDAEEKLAIAHVEARPLDAVSHGSSSSSRSSSPAAKSALPAPARLVGFFL